MATIPKHVAKLRTLIREHSDDSRFSDEYLMGIMNTVRGTLYSRRLRRYFKLSDWDIKRYCIGLEKALSHDCSCVKVGCLVLKSKYPLPEPLSSRFKEMITVYDLSGNELEKVSEKEQKTNIYDDIKNQVPTYSITNNYLVIWNNLDFKAVEVEGLWYDETQWASIKYCDPVTGDDLDFCFDLDTTEYGLDPDLELPLYQEVLKLLGIALSLPEDRTNDSSSAIKE